MCAASNSHSPNRCKILLHFGRAVASVARFSFVIDKIDVKLLAEGGPELGPITVLILVDRLLVRLMREPFESPVRWLEAIVSLGRKKCEAFANDVRMNKTTQMIDDPT